MADPEPAAEPAPEPEPAAGSPSNDDRNLAVVTHLLGILFSFLGALIVWLLKKDSSEYLDDQAKEALNFQITVLLAQVISGMLVAVGIGCFLAPAVYLANIILCVVAAVAASKGERYRYPVALRLIH